MILIRDFWTEPGGDREISCLALVVEFDSNKIKPGGLFEAIQISITLVIDAHERAAITDSSPAHIQERLRLLCRELCPLFGSLLIAQSLEQEVTPARLKPNQLRPFRRRSQIAFNNIRCRKALLQDHTNNRRSHPEKAFNLHLPHLTCGAARLGGYLAELEALEMNQASGYVRVEGAKMTTSWLRQGGKMPPSGVARAQVQVSPRQHC